MRKLGIDFGSKKVGLALTDEGGRMAFPHSVVPHDQHLLETITALIDSEGVAEVVIGHSHNPAGGENSIQSAITDFITDLTLACGVPIALESEVYTTAEAARIQGRNEKTDAAAAAIILNSYLLKQGK